MGSIYTKEKSKTKMISSSFAEGLSVEYKNCSGVIKFISEFYLTICIQDNPDKSRDVCLVVPPYEWDNIKLNKESTK